MIMSHFCLHANLAKSIFIKTLVTSLNQLSNPWVHNVLMAQVFPHNK
jgi:hypothetical protein